MLQKISELPSGTWILPKLTLFCQRLLLVELTPILMRFII